MAPTISTVRSPLGSKAGALQPLTSNTICSNRSPPQLKFKAKKDSKSTKEKRESLDSLEEFNREYDEIMQSPPLGRTKDHAPTRVTDSYSSNELALDEMPTPDAEEARARGQRALARANEINLSRVQVPDPVMPAQLSPSGVASGDDDIANDATDTGGVEAERGARAILARRRSEHEKGGLTWIELEKKRKAGRSEISGMKAVVAAERMFDVDTSHAVPAVTVSSHSSGGVVILRPDIPGHLLVQLEQLKQECIVNEEVTYLWDEEDRDEAIKQRMNLQALGAATYDNTVAIKKDTETIPQMKEQLGRIEKCVGDLADRYSLRGRHNMAVAKANTMEKALSAQQSITQKQINSAIMERMTPETMMGRKTKASESNQNPRNRKAELEHYKKLSRARQQNKKKPFGF